MREIIQITPSAPAFVRKKRVAAYARVSLDSERLMHSLSAQVSYYSELIQKNPQWLYAGVYADEGITGTLTSKRDEFKRMIEDCEKGKIDIILVKSISRFARNTVDLLDTVRHLKSLGIEVRFEKENINSLSNDGELMLSILASFAQEESCSISENVKWGTRKRFEIGIPNGRVRVYGYRWKGDTLLVEPSEAEVVKRIYTEFLNGSSPRKVAESLNRDGIKTEKGYTWNDFNTRYILMNITYTGNMLLQKTFSDNPISKKRKKNKGELPQYFVENTHEAIIDKATFDKVQSEFGIRSKKRKTVFREKVKCSHCGNYYTRNTYGEKGKPYKSWVCKTKKNNGRNVCSSVSIREEKLKEVSADVLGLSEFEDDVFEEQIKCVVMDGKDTIHFEFYDGNIITKKWKSTLIKDTWTQEKRSAMSERMKKSWKEKKNGREDSKNNTCNG